MRLYRTFRNLTSLKSYLFDYHCLYCINMFVDDLIICVNVNSLNKILASLSRIYTDLKSSIFSFIKANIYSKNESCRILSDHYLRSTANLCSTHNFSIFSDEGLTLETSAQKLDLYGSQFRLSTQWNNLN